MALEDGSPPADALVPASMSGLEHAARVLVQKLAREHAASRASILFRLEHVGRLEEPLVHEESMRYAQRARGARVIRETAVRLLRLELGLPADPLPLEVEGWDAAP